MYQGNVAYRLDASQAAWDAPARNSYFVYEGDGRDARTRNDASSALATLLKVVLTLGIVYVALGFARVALTVETVSLMRDIKVAESTVARERDTKTELSVERSALTNTDRIQRIATENYGMVFATDVDVISVSLDEEEQAEDNWLAGASAWLFEGDGDTSDQDTQDDDASVEDVQDDDASAGDTQDTEASAEDAQDEIDAESATSLA